MLILHWFFRAKVSLGWLPFLSENPSGYWIGYSSVHGPRFRYG
jgi:hypothetical protein